MSDEGSANPFGSDQNESIEVSQLSQRAEQEANQIRNVLNECYQLKDDMSAMQIALQNTTSQLGEELTATIQSNIGAANEQLESFNSHIVTLQSRSSELQDSIHNKQNELNQLQIQLSEKQAKLETLHSECLTKQQEIIQLRESATTLTTSVSNDVESIKQNSQLFSTLLATSNAEQADVKTTHAALKEQLSKIKDMYSEIDVLYRTLLIDDVESNGEIKVYSRKSEIKELLDKQKMSRKEMVELANKSKQDIIELKKALEEEIRSLLPKAGAAGLASAFVQAKARYGVIEYEKQNATNTIEKFLLNPLKWVFHHIPIQVVIFYGMFLIPLILMVWQAHELYLNLQSISTKILIFKFLITLPLGAISLFGFMSIRLNRRLFEEYNHKQRVMQLYHSFKSEIDQHGSKEQQAELLKMMINTVQDKPSLAMSKYDGHVTEELLNKLFTGINLAKPAG